jgi:adenylate cyclase
MREGLPAPTALEWKQGNRRAALAIAAAHVSGAVFTFVYLTFIVPSESTPRPSSRFVDVLVFVLYAVVAFPLTGAACLRAAQRAMAWMIEGRDPTEEERAQTLSFARRVALITMVPWIGAAAFFAATNVLGGHTARHIVKVAFTTIDGGLVSCTIGFLLVERVLRPVVAQVLDGMAPAGRAVSGVRLRLVVTWMLGSGVPLAGLALLPIAADRTTSELDLAPAILVLSIAGLIAGFVITVATAKSVAEPINEVRAALEEVQQGRFDVAVTVDRAGDLGELQAGVNRMVEGLRERQRLADLFGRHVGTEVAQRAIAQGAGIDSEQREASVLFVDLIGSTALAEVLAPDEVVRTLNAYFDTVVRVVSAEGGWVNKFQGDGALCVFGAPAIQPDHAARALRSARALNLELRALAATFPGVDAAIGVSSGPLVAGNVGTEQRYEYTVIGRPVNEAARLTDLAKSRPGRVLAGEGALDRAGDESARWISLGTVVLRGQAAPASIFEPVPIPVLASTSAVSRAE